MTHKSSFFILFKGGDFLYFVLLNYYFHLVIITVIINEDVIIENCALFIIERILDDSKNRCETKKYLLELTNICILDIIYNRH